MAGHRARACCSGRTAKRWVAGVGLGQKGNRRWGWVARTRCHGADGVEVGGGLCERTGNPRVGEAGFGAAASRPHPSTLRQAARRHSCRGSVSA